MATDSYRLQIMPRAAIDMDNIYGYISQELSAPAAAQKLMEKIETSLMSLCDMPERCPVCRDSILQQKGYRKLIVGNYVALFIVDNKAKTVTIMRVFHGRQDYTNYV